MSITVLIPIQLMMINLAMKFLLFAWLVLEYRRRKFLGFWQMKWFSLHDNFMHFYTENVSIQAQWGSIRMMSIPVGLLFEFQTQALFFWFSHRMPRFWVQVDAAGKYIKKIFVEQNLLCVLVAMAEGTCKYLAHTVLSFMCWLSSNVSHCVHWNQFGDMCQLN